MKKGEKPTCVALIPARSGSKRVPNKNIRPLKGHPVIAYTITAALDSGIFQDVIVSTDSELYAEVAVHYGAEVPFLRPKEIAGDLSPDVEWVEYTLQTLRKNGRAHDCFSILRPTSPFRLPTTIQRAWSEFCGENGIDSLRAVEKCAQHPAKMWIIRGKRMLPVMPFGPEAQPWHSSQYQSLPVVYVQNASLEIAWSKIALEQRSIAGNVIAPFLTEDYEGFDVNKEYDWQMAEKLAHSEAAALPMIRKKPYKVQ